MSSPARRMAGRGQAARVVVAVDGVGCGLAAICALVSSRMGPDMAPIATRRFPLAVALGATGVSLLLAARAVRDEDLERAALVNGAWVVACAVGVNRLGTPTARTLAVVTAVADGAMAACQLGLRSGNELRRA